MDSIEKQIAQAKIDALKTYFVKHHTAGTEPTLADLQELIAELVEIFEQKYGEKPQ